LNRGSFALPSTQTSGSTTKGSIGDIYLEPINLGWHFKQLDAIVSSGVVMPSGPYNANARVNIGYGHWTGMFGLGGIAYFDSERTWSLSIYSHYELYGSQMGRSYILGDDLPLEWGAGKSINLGNDILKQLTIGAVGYAQWQATDNQINVKPNTAIGTGALNKLENVSAHVYSAGPSITALTKFGLFTLRYYEEFGYVVVRNLVPRDVCEAALRSYADEVKSFDGFIYRQTTANPERHVFTDHGFMLNPILNVQSVDDSRFPTFRRASLAVLTHPPRRRERPLEDR